MSGSSVSVTFPLAELNASVDAAALALHQARRDMLEQIGVQLLSFARLDYVTKSRGGTGTDGVTWAPIKVVTILARLRKAGHLKRKVVGTGNQSVRVVAKTVKKNAPLFRELARAGVKFRNGKTGKIVKGTGNRHKAGTTLHLSKETQSKSVSLSPGSYQIGVDTGLQLNSASPGYTAPDGKGGNVKTRTDDSITVGFGRSYSKYFDEKRKLFPDVLPQEWVKELEEIAAGVGGEVVENALKDKGVS